MAVREAQARLVAVTSRPWAAWRAMRARHVPMIPLAIIIVLLVFAALPGQIAPYDPLKQNLTEILHPPFYQEGGSLSHPLGTDRLGRDVFSRIVYGARISLLISGTVTLCGGTLGTFLGILSGYMGGKTDAVIQRGVEAVLALPIIMIALVFVFIVGASITSVMFILAPFIAVGFARVVRGEALSLKVRDYVEVARVIGTPTLRIMLRHILPNLFNTVVVLVTLDVARLILMEASLSFLGVGVPPPNPAWGLMVSDGRVYVATKYWLSLFPGLAIVATVLALNLFGDWLRDFLDPMRRQL